MIPRNLSKNAMQDNFEPTTLSLSEMIEHKRKTSMEDKRKSSKEEPAGRKLSTEHRKQSKEEKN